MTPAEHQRVAELLGRSRVASAAVDIALSAKDPAEASRLELKARDLRRQAQELDPQHECQSWQTQSKNAHT